MSADQWPLQNLSAVVMNILTSAVTKSLPPSWQGQYTEQRAKNWITERDNEAVVLLVVEATSANAIGIVILFESGSDQNGIDLRLGYILAEQFWGQGFATELLNGLVNMASLRNIKSVAGGVEKDNIASTKVLEKCGFNLSPASTGCNELLYVLRFATND
ncbi:MAG: hypothetical protein OFPI_09770 [Osedax symbiont Rs2]|nr:MAG: hypothetical protein OFPI_09770 [Osedax symbiont Rs2]